MRTKKKISFRYVGGARANIYCRLHTLFSFCLLFVLRRETGGPDAIAIDQRDVDKRERVAEDGNGGGGGDSGANTLFTRSWAF